MINGKQNKQYFYNIDNNKNMNLKNNSQVLSHQENNYYYNTKINHLIFQHDNSNNPDKKNCKKMSLPLNNMYISYDILDSNLNYGNKIITRNLENSYYKNSISLKKSDKLKNMKITLNETDVNMNSKNNYDLISSISTTRKKNVSNTSKNLYSKNITTSNYNIDSNKNNNIKNKKSFQGVNKPKKKKDININNIDNNNEDLKNSKIKSPKNEVPKKNNENNNNNTYIDLMSYKNINNNYFYNIQNNYEKNDNDNKQSKKDISGRKNIFLNNLISINSTRNNDMNNKKIIPIKNNYVGNYPIKSSVSTLTDKNNKNRRYKINNTPETSENKKIKYNLNKNNKSNVTNKFSNIISHSNKEFLDTQENKTLINVNIKNKNKLLNNYENKNTRRNVINNINIYNSLPKKSATNKINDKNIKKEKGQNVNNINMNHSNINNTNETFIKINQKNHKNKINYYYNQLESSRYNILNDIKLKKLCDIIEQIFYTSFRNNYRFFIQKLILYYEYIISKRSLIIRRFESVKRTKNSNIKINNNSYSSNSIRERISKNKEINTQMKKSKSPSKFLELQDNLKSSMMKINQDNYIQMFNALFMKQREDY